MTAKPVSDPRRRLPSVTRLMENPRTAEALSRLPRTVVVDAIRSELSRIRASGSNSVGEDEIIARALEHAAKSDSPSLKRAINATGVILHTGLGRAVLAESARNAVCEVASGHSLLEIESDSGKRGSRQSHVRGLLCELTGAESALVLNNNAGAVFLSVTALAAGKEVVISRGELVEIGGSFRMPDIIRASGASLVEVGTTNKTRLSDFEHAITENTGLLLRCHPSNFKIVGFTDEVPPEKLAELGARFGVPVMDDLGSGAVLELAESGSSITLGRAIQSGCDVVTASGDKLLGGPQCGIILGTKEIVDKIAAQPLARALRVDKLTLAALEATLKLYRDPERAKHEIPTLRYLGRTFEELMTLAARLVQTIGNVRNLSVDLAESESQVGGGSLPGEDLHTVCVRIIPRGSGFNVERLATELRTGNPPIFGRIRDNALLLDLRTLERDEFGDIAESLKRIFNAAD